MYSSALTVTVKVHKLGGYEKNKEQRWKHRVHKYYEVTR